jgi:two-component system response regulator AtoC
VNCGTLTDELLESELFGSEHVGVSRQPEAILGKFEQCAQGTVLLEDLDAMPIAGQRRLQNLLQTRELVRCGGQTRIRVDVRIMVALNGQLETAAIADQELSHRLSTFRLYVPPLRERLEEIPLLLGHFMNRLARHYGVSPPRISSTMLAVCEQYSWPGNLRELENFAKRFLAIGDENRALEEFYLHPDAGSAKSHAKGTGAIPADLEDAAATKEKSSLKVLARRAKNEAERSAIAEALEQTQWNRKEAARLLNISYRGLLYKIEEYCLVPPVGLSKLREAK